MQTTTMLLLLLCARVASAQEIPWQLKAAREYVRGSFDTARIEWVADCKSCGDALYSFTTKYAHDQEILVYRGDLNKDGASSARIEGMMPEGLEKEFLYSDRSHLYTPIPEFAEMEYFYKTEGIMTARIGNAESQGMGRGSRQPDLQTAALYAADSVIYRGDDFLNANPLLGSMMASLDFGPSSVTETEDHCVVEAEVVSDQGENRMTMRWVLNPKKGYRCERVESTIELGGQELVPYWSETTYESIDGVEFPVDIVYKGQSYRRLEDGTRVPKGPEKVRARFSVLSAEIDRPHHPQTFTPRDIGILRGDSVDAGGLDILVWDEPGFITNMEAVARRDAGELEWQRESDERHSKIWQSEHKWCCPTDEPVTLKSPRIVEISADPGLWEEYTRRFMVKNKFSLKQKRKGWEILRDSQDVAYGYFKKVDKRIQKLDKQGGSQADGDELATIAKRKLRLLEPLDTIFEKRLQRGLEKVKREGTRKGEKSKVRQDDPPGS